MVATNPMIPMPVKARPYDHQYKAFDFACEKFGLVPSASRSNGVALLMEMGTGKTHLARNQADSIRCGDNGIFKGVPMTKEQMTLSGIARDIYAVHPYDGKYLLSKALFFAAIRQTVPASIPGRQKLPKVMLQSQRM